MLIPNAAAQHILIIVLGLGLGAGLNVNNLIRMVIISCILLWKDEIQDKSDQA